MGRGATVRRRRIDSTMPAASLAVGLIRTALLALPVVAVQFTARDPETSVAVSLLWAVQLLKGFGYDVVQHFAGTEANAYLVALLCVKTLPYIGIEWESLEYWIPLLFVEIVYSIALRTSYRVYFDEWRFSEKQAEAIQHRGKKHGDRSNHNAISWLSLLLLFGVVTAFNAVRVILFYFHTEATLDLEYNDDGTLLMWCSLAETLLAAVLVLRLPSLYTPSSTDFWKDAGGVIFIYLYYVFVTLWIMPDAALLGVSIAMIACTVLALVAVDHQVTVTDNGIVEFAGEVLVQWFWELVAIIFSEPIAQVLFLVMCSVLAYGGRSVWYTTVITFPLWLQEATCPVVSFLDGPVQVFYTVTGDPQIASIIAVLAVYISRIRIKIARIMTVAYPGMAAACGGATTSVAPLQIVWLVPFLGFPWFFGLLLTLQVFPEAHRITTKSSFWAMTFVACLLSMLVIQATGDLFVSFFYVILNGSRYDRTYTDTGAWLTMVQLFQLALCCAMFYHRHQDEEIRKQVLHTASSPGALKKAATKVVNLADRVLTPTWMFAAISVALFVFSVLAGPPVDSIQFVQIPNNQVPTWITNNTSPLDQFKGEATNLAGMISQRVKGAIVVANLAVYAFKKIPCFPVGAVDVCIGDYLGDIVSLLIQGIDLALNSTIGAISDAIIKAIGNGTLADIDRALKGLVALDAFDDFQLVDLPAIELGYLRYPGWLPVLLFILALLIVAVQLLALVFGGRLNTISKIGTLSVVSILLTFITFICNFYFQLYQYGYNLEINWSDDVLPYAIALVAFVCGVVLFFVTEENEARKEKEERRLESTPGTDVDSD